jgi:hypothetical protein
MTTQKNRGNVGHGDFYPGRVADKKGGALVNSRAVEFSPGLVRD